MTETAVRAFGFGGQGIITLARLVGEAGILDKKEIIMTEEYSPYITGGWSRADLIVSEKQIDYPMVSQIDHLITLSQEGLDTNAAKVPESGMIYIEEGMVNPSALKNRRTLGVNAKEIAESLGNQKVTNIIMLGFFNRISGLVSRKSLEVAVKNRFPKFEKLNLAALDAGYKEGDSYV